MKCAVVLLCVVMVTVCVARRPDRWWNRGDRAAGGRNKFRLSSFLDYARPYLEGELRLGPFFDVDWDLLGQQNVDQWWKGPNVCHSRQETEAEDESGDITHHHMMGFMSCDQTDTYYKCTQSMMENGKKKTTTNTLECCYGFEREFGTSGCTKELILKGLIETMESLGLNDVVRGIESVALTPLLEEGNFTVFAPVDGSFDIPDHEQMEDTAMQSNVIMLYPHSSDIVDQVRDILASHVVQAFYKSGNLEDEQVIETISPAGSTIRINKYQAPRKLTTANCVPVETMDHLATNGIVHVVDKLLPPVKHTLYELIVSDPQFTTLKTVLARAEFGRVLEGDGSYTLFAPTNAAFEKLGSRLERLLDSGECLTNVLKTHLLPHVICSAVIESRARTKNTLDVFLHVMRNDTDKLFVEHAQIVKRDVMALNGVMHVIDDVILPDGALDIIEILEKNNYNDILELLEFTNLTKEIATTPNVTILLPSQQAIENIPVDTYRELLDNKEKLREVLKYHVITDGQLSSCQVRNGAELSTLDSDKKIAIRQYSSFPFRRSNVLTAQCARVTETTDIKSCNAIAHVIDKVLIPPVGDVIDTLSMNTNFSIFVSLLRESGIAEELQLTGPFTIFAPLNQYLEVLDLEVLRNDVEKLETFLKNHIMPEILCCAGVFSSSWGKSPYERMLGGKDVLIRRRRNEIHVGGKSIESCDMTATNGVVHSLTGILDEADVKSVPQLDLYSNNPWIDFNIDDHFQSLLARRHQRQNRRKPEGENEDEWPWWMRRLAKSW